MRYDYSAHMSLNESIRQIGSREHDISIIQSIIEDVFSRADALLESEEFFIEFYADNKAKLNTLLTESVLTEEEFLSYVTPIIVEGLWDRIMGEKLPTDEYRAKIAAVRDLANAAYSDSNRGNTTLQGKAEDYRKRMTDKLKAEYTERAKKQGGLRGFGRRLMDKLGGSSVFRAIGTKPYSELEIEDAEHFDKNDNVTAMKQRAKNLILNKAQKRIDTKEKEKRKPITTGQKELFREPDETMVARGPRRKKIISVGDREKLKKSTEMAKLGRTSSGQFLMGANKKPLTTGEQGSLF